jgi:hypothetical protein
MASLKLGRVFDRGELIELVDGLLHPKAGDLPSDELAYHLKFFGYCRDQSAAIDVTAEAPPTAIVAELVGRALSFPGRTLDSAPHRVLSADIHCAR